MSDADGYPTEEELQRVREWPLSDPKGWLEYVRDLWHYPEMWSVESLSIIDDGYWDKHLASTGGWSGNEDVIAAMQENAVLWATTWRTHRRGGHYEFGVRQ